MAAAGEFLRAYGMEEMAVTWVGWDAKTGHIPAIPAAIVVYGSILALGYILMNMSKILPQPVREYVMDFLLTMTLCAYPFGHGIMRKYYGEPGFLLAAVPLLILTFAVVPEADGSPLDCWMKYFKKTMSLQKCLAKSVLQIVAGFTAYHLGMFILNLQLHPDYVDRLTEYYKSFCMTDLNVPIYVGFLIEFCGVVYDSWLCSLTLVKSKQLDDLIKIVNAMLLVSAGVHFTGMYMHPAMATGHTWGCGETPRAAHILIYWVGPMIGVWLSVQIQNRFPLSKLKPKTVSKAKSRKSVGAANGVEYSNGQMNATNGTARRRRKKFYN